MSDDIPLADDAPTAPRSMALAGLLGQAGQLLAEGRLRGALLIVDVDGAVPRVGLHVQDHDHAQDLLLQLLVAVQGACSLAEVSGGELAEISEVLS